jgi:CRISPR-associated exonuclease Cas4
MARQPLQVCTQAFCLEEMLGVPVTAGVVYSIQTCRRRAVSLNDVLRRETQDAIAAVRALNRSAGPLPPAVNDKRCPKCSLIDACVPATVVAARHARLAATLFVPAEELA